MSEAVHPDDGANLARAVAFVSAIEDRCAAKTVIREWGRLLSYPELPLVWALNFARVDDPGAFSDAASLAEAVTGLPWPAVVAHRRVVVNDEPAGARLAPGFVALGWEVERLLYMRLRGDATPATGPAPVRELSSEERAAALPDYLPQIDAKYKPDVLHQIAASRRVVEQATNVRRFASFVDGGLASLCELYVDGTTAQIEDVTTAERFRGRGLSKAVVGTAIAAARSAGAGFVFLIAEADDWPKEMYRRMGFEDIGITYEFHLAGAG